MSNKKLKDVFHGGLVKLPSWFNAEQKQYVLMALDEHDKLKERVEDLESEIEQLKLDDIITFNLMA